MGSYKVLYDYPNYASLPAVGDVSRLYITNDTNTLYRWVDGAYHFFTTTSVPWGNIDGVLTNQTDLMAVLNGKQPLITAGTSAQYYRGDKTFQTLNTTAVPEGTNLYWTDARFNTGFSGKSTSNLTEGSNLYYTDARFDSRLSTKSTSNLTEGSNLYWTNERFDTRLGLKTTSDLSEGSNLYYTDARFDTRFNTKTTDNLTEGSTKLYYSSSRFNADFNNKNTDNLPEGSTNLFWTPARSRNAMTLLTVGTSGLATYNSTTGQLNIPQYQDLLVNPLVGAGAQYYVPRYSGTTSLTPGLIYDNGVYVGINRTNPFYTLDVNGTLNVQGVSIYRNLAGTGERLVYVDSTGTLTPAIIGSGLSLTSGTLTATGTASGSIGGSGTIGYIPKFSGTAAITNSNIQDSGSLITLGSNTTINGSITNSGTQPSIGTSSLPYGTMFIINLRADTNLSLGAGYGTSGENGLRMFSSTRNIVIQNGGTFTDLGQRLQVTGTSYFTDSLGVGTTSLTGYVVNIAKNITGATTAYGVRSQGTVQSDVTTLVSNYGSLMNTAAASFTLTDFVHHRSMQGTIGSGSAVTNQYGYFADSSMTGATNNYGFYGNIALGTNRYNLYMNGTANNYLAGSLAIGGSPVNGQSLNIVKNITGNAYGFGIVQSGQIQSDVTIQGYGYINQLSTQASSFTLPDYFHYFAQQQTIGAGSTVTNQYGFNVSSSLIGATNNYGFYGSIPSGSNRWNIYMNGTAKNYLAGSLLIGSTTDAGYKLDVTGTTRLQGDTSISSGGLGIGTTILNSHSLRISKSITGSVGCYGISQTGIVQSDVTSNTYGYFNQSNTQATAFTLGEYNHYFASQGTIGSGSAITTQQGFVVNSNLTGATNNYGFRGVIGAGTNRYNIYMDGTAQNYLAGALSIGVSTANASALLQVDSTTQGVLFPRMTTTQKNAISSPATGLVIFDTTLGKLCVYSTTWQTITSV